MLPVCKYHFRTKVSWLTDEPTSDDDGKQPIPVVADVAAQLIKQI